MSVDYTKDSFLCSCGGTIKKQQESTCWTCDTCDFSKREMKKQPIVRCFYCKRKIYKGEKVSSVSMSFGDYVGKKHVICRNCTESLGVEL